MMKMMSFPVFRDSMAEYKDTDELLESCRRLKLDGIEAVWGGDDAMDSFPDGSAAGYHLIFYPDWLDFWRGDEMALLGKFGSRESWVSFYGGEDRQALIRQYRADMARAVRLGARYVVFHVSDVSIEEGYTYRWLHSDREVLDGSIELINCLFDKDDYPFELLVENQWWPGFTFTDPARTEYLLDAIHYRKKGILLDTGHLMNTNLSIRTEADGISYIREMLELHGPLCRSIRGMHLHQSLSGAYVQANTGSVPKGLSEDYVTQFGQSYAHILKIDRHMPWTDPGIAEIVRDVAPEYLTYELSCRNRTERERAILTQQGTLEKGGL